MSRLILSLFILSLCQLALSQPHFRATYSSKASPIIDIQIDFDSSFNDDTDTSGFVEFFTNYLGGVIEASIVLVTKSKTSDIEVTPVKKVQSEGVIYAGAKYKWDGAKLFFYNPDLGKYVPSDKKPVYLKYTAATKEIFGYTCKEAKSEEKDSVQVTAWICEQLPFLINPAVPIKGVSGAVMEYIEKGGKEIIIKKLETIEKPIAK